MKIRLTGYWVYRCPDSSLLSEVSCLRFRLPVRRKGLTCSSRSLSHSPWEEDWTSRHSVGVSGPRPVEDKTKRITTKTAFCSFLSFSFLPSLSRQFPRIVRRNWEGFLQRYFYFVFVLWYDNGGSSYCLNTILTGGTGGRIRCDYSTLDILGTLSSIILREVRKRKADIV